MDKRVTPVQQHLLDDIVLGPEYLNEAHVQVLAHLNAGYYTETPEFLYEVRTVDSLVRKGYLTHATGMTRIHRLTDAGQRWCAERRSAAGLDVKERAPLNFVFPSAQAEEDGAGQESSTVV